jgi:hypothetical protein
MIDNKIVIGRHRIHAGRCAQAFQSSCRENRVGVLEHLIFFNSAYFAPHFLRRSGNIIKLFLRDFQARIAPLSLNVGGAVGKFLAEMAECRKSFSVEFRIFHFQPIHDLPAYLEVQPFKVMG